MNKYVLEEYVLNGFDASSKAREDVSKFILEFGFKSIGENDKSKTTSAIKKILLTIKIYVLLLTKLNSNDMLFLQTSLEVLKGVSLIKMIKRFKTIYLIHDVFSIRYDNSENHINEIEGEISLLNKMDFVICHNKKMKERLAFLGCTSNLVELEIFDYRVSNNTSPIDQYQNTTTIAFAGNIGKSPFLKKLDNKINKLKVNVYGNPATHFNKIIYKGTIPAEELPSKIEGMFGLIWEGNYIVEEKNNYLRFNNPHKTSLYIVSGLPIVIWSKAAMADFIVSNHIGITIDSLDELEDKINNISQTEYNEMRNNCLTLRKQLLHGEHLHKAIESIFESMEENKGW